MILPLLERFRPLLRLQVQRLELDARLRRRFDSSDLVQEALTRAVGRADQFRGTTEAEAFCWLQQILRTVVLNTIERETAEVRNFQGEFPIDELLTESSVRVVPLLTSPSPAPDQRAAQCDALFRLAEGIERLLPDQRDVVNLWSIHRYKVDEIAELLQKTPKAVAGLLRRGLDRLREFAKDIGLTPP